MDDSVIIESTRRWIANVVIGLNLCPFAQRVFVGEKIRYVVSPATEENALLQDLKLELENLAATSIKTVETTLLIHPNALGNFLDFNDFLEPAETLIESLDLDGIIQLASFHPHYQFAGTRPDDVENFTNRSPYPMLHLLREDSITAVADDPESLNDIPKRNIEVLRGLGAEGIRALLARVAEPEA